MLDGIHSTEVDRDSGKLNLESSLDEFDQLRLTLLKGFKR